jgi:hypothetical protein
MAIRDKMRANAAPQLQPGETIQAVFAGQAVNPYWSLVSFWIIILKSAFRMIVVTDKRIFVCQPSRWSITQCKSVLRELPRSTRLGPTSGFWYKTDVLGEMVWIHKRFHKDIAAADAAAGVA